MNYILHDVASMNPKDSMGNQSSGNYSVSKCLVYFGIPIHCNNDAIKCVCCIVHGAMLAVSRLDNSRMLYRCEVCNNGAIIEELVQKLEISAMNHHEDIVSESVYRYDDFILHCSNILEGLVKIGYEVDPMLINKLTKQEQNKFKNTYSEALDELQKTLHTVILRKRRNEPTPEWFFQGQRKKLQKIDEELVPILHDLKFQITD